MVLMPLHIFLQRGILFLQREQQNHDVAVKDLQNSIIMMNFGSKTKTIF